MQYRVTLDFFEGPLDLLLHLVEVNEVNILDLPVAQIAEQYLAIVSRQPPEDLARAGEYLVMAATLVRLKGRTLLPPDPVAVESEEDDGEGVDPAEELARRLLEYRAFREAAATLDRLRAARALCFPRDESSSQTVDLPENSATGESTVAYNPLTAAALVRAFRNLLRRHRPELLAQGIPSAPLLSVADAARRVLRRLRAAGKRIAFEQLFDEGDGRSVWIVVFLALLELVRRGRLTVEQERPFATIWVQMH